MGPGQVPAQQIGHVGAAEVNHTSRVVADVVRNNHLPQKIFMVHQFRREMVVNIQNVRGRRGLAMVQHVDGFGTRSQKLATYHRVAEPRQFRMGFKLFYDEDTRTVPPAGGAGDPAADLVRQLPVTRPRRRTLEPSWTGVPGCETSVRLA